MSICNVEGFYIADMSLVANATQVLSNGSQNDTENEEIWSLTNQINPSDSAFFLYALMVKVRERSQSCTPNKFNAFSPLVARQRCDDAMRSSQPAKAQPHFVRNRSLISHPEVSQG